MRPPREPPLAALIEDQGVDNDFVGLAIGISCGLLALLACLCFCALWKFHKRHMKAKHARDNAPIEVIDIDNDPESARNLIEQFGGNPDEVLNQAPTKEGLPDFTPEDEDLLAEHKSLDADLAAESKRVSALEKELSDMEKEHEAFMHKLNGAHQRLHAVGAFVHAHHAGPSAANASAPPAGSAAAAPTAPSPAAAPPANLASSRV